MEPFSTLLALCPGYSPVTGEYNAQRPVTRGFDVFFYLFLNKRLSKQSWGWWSETPSRSLWRHCNGQFSDRHLHAGSMQANLHITKCWPTVSWVSRVMMSCMSILVPICENKIREHWFVEFPKCSETPPDKCSLLVFIKNHLWNNIWKLTNFDTEHR